MRFRFPYFQSSNSIFLGPAIGARLIQSATHPLTCPPREPSYGHMCLSTRLGSSRIRRRPTRNVMQPHALAHRDQGVGGLTDILKDAPTYAYAQRGNQAKLAEHQRSKHDVPSMKKGSMQSIAWNPDADRARFELAEGCPSTVFKTVSLDRSDICPICITHETSI